ncbi:MAG: bifunctional glutamate N-acetyltransferase/amino-acid acetyltransferase ArgJ [Candidatus Nitrohelix vancouverensis]|uniref:Arginine biosynthesis bifunctional protein ArgJ n=1 Tax=Candidatus Nitrohelix vancouverensis TaxID=2705534 RepID=A0A7T0BZS1_9BACT|nr:MAG: bifunctional glutamate N-acetyltransferase/amino-acid acetyltransferase ArgJ [Candidatus Nitrohelix vancouverensis]
MKLIKGKLPSVPGFKTAGIACGIKANKNLDLALIVSDVPASGAGVFTTNRVAAPCVTHCQRALARRRPFRAIVVNSGNANACTGDQGAKDCRAMARAVASELNISPKETLVASTGIIGVPLPVEKIEQGAPQLKNALSEKGWKNAAKAIMTTDLQPKMASTQFNLFKRTISIGGISKGSGMIHPNMATMLGFVVTDIAIRPIALKTALTEAVNKTFNRITVDGDTSTNDCVLVMANGLAGNKELTASSAGYPAFVEALTEVCKSLALQIVQDGEGATKLATIRVSGGKSEKAAHQVANAIAKSPLVKTALFGEDPNWGRILAAAGYSGAPFDPDEIEISLNGAPLFRNGAPVKTTSQAQLAKKMKSKEILIEFNMARGSHTVDVYTCDFSYDYVRINAEYTT